MSKYYDFKTIEAKWQKYWQDNKTDRADDNDNKREKFYCLDMFPYPSGEGLHVGHPEGYTATDIYSRFMRMNGYNVLHPMGWDAFGLPAENYAIKKGIHPKETTTKNIARFKNQIQSLGLSYDWDREINTSDPNYYKWTQWLFLKLYEYGLAYQRLAPVNWCKNCKTVLAREQVMNGKCERCGNIVIQKELKQWFFKITEYAEELLNDLDRLDWPENIKEMQRNWIGKSEGALIKFPIFNYQFSIEVYTTRPDTIFGATYLVLAPEHELIASLLNIKNQKSKIKNIEEVEKYIKATQKKTELERSSLEKVKTGVELKGIYAINPVNKKKIPVYIADYVLTTYGTGAIMAVPAHDKRDFDFAKKYNLNIIEVISKDGKKSNLENVYSDVGILLNSGKFNGKNSDKVKNEIIKLVSGKKSIQYRLRDWLVSRQRYWGAPIPIIYCDKCGIVPVPEADLPVELPDDVDFKPTGESPLVNSKSFHNVKCPKCQSPARRESDTMDTFVCSSWYFLRYVDPNNKSKFADNKLIKKWLPVDLYVGGAEHAVMHLLYARFITKALQDMKYLEFGEPFTKLRNQGLILASDGRKMSKSLGNVINPDEVIAEYGADAMRLYEMFMGPLEDSKPWDIKGIIGVKRFLDKVWNYSIQLKTQNAKRKTTSQNSKLLNQTIKKVTEDIKNLRFNTAISAMMIYINAALGHQIEVTLYCKEQFIKILAPFAPHLAEELWEKMGHKNSIFNSQWPQANEIKSTILNIPIQINGKVRTVEHIESILTKDQIETICLNNIIIKKWIEGKNIKKIIYIPGKILNIVVE